MYKNSQIKRKIFILDFKEKEARKRFTGVEIILYNLDRLHINVSLKKIFINS